MSSEKYEQNGYGHDLDFQTCANCMFNILQEVDCRAISIHLKPTYTPI